MEFLLLCAAPLGAALIALAAAAAFAAARRPPSRVPAPERAPFRLLASAAHDLRAPLASVHGYSARLLRSALPPRAARYAERIARGARHMGLVADQLTDAAVLEAGRLKPRMARFDLSELAADACAAVRALAEEKGQAFAEPAVPAGTWMGGDRAQLTRAVVNLLANAVKFAPRGGRVGFKVWVSGRSAVLEVSDDGPGVPYSQRRRIFEAFHQARWRDEKKGREGWGLGLAVAQEVVAAHGGEISVRGGPGSVFRVRVPLRGPALRAPRAAAALALLALALPVRAELPAEAKARFESVLASRATLVLDRMLGPGRSAAAVNAELDFGKVERVVAGPMAGLPYPKPILGAGESPYESRLSFASSPVKRLTVTVVLDKKVSTEQEDQATRVLSDVLDVRADRGDTLSFVRAPFASRWREPGALAGAARAFLLVAAALAACAAAVFLLLKVSRAVEALARPPEPAPAAARSEERRLVFDVQPDQVEALRSLMDGQDPDNFALVAAHLPAEAGRALLSGLSEDLRNQVVSSLAKPRFVDPDLILEVKEAVERRLSGAVGGRQAAALLEGGR